MYMVPMLIATRSEIKDPINIEAQMVCRIEGLNVFQAIAPAVSVSLFCSGSSCSSVELAFIILMLRLNDGGDALFSPYS